MIKRIHYYNKIYYLLISKYIKSRMEYRQDFVISLVGIFVENFLGLAFYSIIFLQIPYIGDWSFDELLFLYGFLVVSTSFFHIFFGNMYNLKAYLITGDYTKFYFRPLNMLFSFISEFLDIKSIFQFIIGIYLLIRSSASLQIIWNLPAILLLCFYILSSAVIIISVMTISASLGFWVRDPSVIMDFMLKIKDYAKYPLTIYGGVLQKIFTFIIPLRFMSYYPSLNFIKGIGDNWYIMALLQIIITIVLLWVAVVVFKKGSDIYDGVGS